MALGPKLDGELRLPSDGWAIAVEIKEAEVWILSRELVGGCAMSIISLVLSCGWD